MANSYKFSVIAARPSDMRGERVNVGVVIFGPEGLDVRMPEVRKLRPLTGHDWEDISEAYVSMLKRTANPDVGIESVLMPSVSMSEVFFLGRPGELRARSSDEYEIAVQKILNYFVDRPVLSRRERQIKINSEISQMLKRNGVLGSPTETIDDGKVVKQFVVSAEKELIADFAYKSNGLKIVSTLDLRGLKSAHSKACEKGVILHFAKSKFRNENLKPLGVYAASPEEVELHKSEIEILKSFADDNAFNWLDARDRQRFQSALY